LGTLYQ
jgi:hypothetical protein